MRFRYRQTETVFNNGSLSELTIESVDRGDSALFTCNASNTYGKDETNIQLIIQGTYDTFIHVYGNCFLAISPRSD